MVCKFRSGIPLFGVPCLLSDHAVTKELFSILTVVFFGWMLGWYSTKKKTKKKTFHACTLDLTDIMVNGGNSHTHTYYLDCQFKSK